MNNKPDNYLALNRWFDKLFTDAQKCHKVDFLGMRQQKKAMIGSDNGLSCDRRQAII